MKPDIQAIQQINPEATFTATEAGRLLGKTRQGILHRINRKQMKAVKICGTWYVSGEQIKAQMEEQREE